MATLEEISERNFKYMLARAMGTVEEKCYDCSKWTIYGKTCKEGECTKE
jgi:hypothetical protein